MNPVENEVPTKPLFVLCVFHRCSGPEQLDIAMGIMAVPNERSTRGISSRVWLRPCLSTDLTAIRW